jgi:hypothetical protein
MSETKHENMTSSRMVGDNVRDLYSRGDTFYLLHSIQTSSRAYQASYSMGTGGSFSRDKAVRA